MGKMIKLLFLAEHPDTVANDIRDNTQAKVISESEIVADTFWKDKTDSPLYSEWLVDRVTGLSQVYRHQRPVAFVINQKHHSAVVKIPHNASIRVCENLTPQRLSKAVSYDTDITITQEQITPEFYQQFFS
jgi:hypothetical protein